MSLGKIQKILQTPTFKKTVKKLKANQKQDLDKAIKSLIDDPLLGQQKKKVTWHICEFLSSKWQNS